MKTVWPWTGIQKQTNEMEIRAQNKTLCRKLLYDEYTTGIEPRNRRFGQRSEQTKFVFQNTFHAAFCRETWVWEQLVAE